MLSFLFPTQLLESGWADDVPKPFDWFHFRVKYLCDFLETRGALVCIINEMCPVSSSKSLKCIKIANFVFYLYLVLSDNFAEFVLSQMLL